MLFAALLLLLAGCHVTAGVYLEKDWQTDESFKNPDLRAKWKLEASRDFKNWGEVLPLPDTNHAAVPDAQ